MIKLGDAYFDEASIMAIQPCEATGAGGPEPSYLIHLAGGGFYQWHADAVEVQRRLEEVGLIAPQSAPVQDFTEGELAELGACLADGFNYAAKDSNGRIFAYEALPDKGSAGWINDDSVSRLQRLTAGQYVALSFEDDCPLDIAVALEGVSEC